MTQPGTVTGADHLSALNTSPGRIEGSKMLWLGTLGIQRDHIVRQALNAALVLTLQVRHHPALATEASVTQRASVLKAPRVSSVDVASGSAS